MPTHIDVYRIENRTTETNKKQSLTRHKGYPGSDHHKYDDPTSSLPTESNSFTNLERTIQRSHMSTL